MLKDREDTELYSPDETGTAELKVRREVLYCCVRVSAYIIIISVCPANIIASQQSF